MRELNIVGKIIEKDSNAVGIVGSRKMTERGEKLAYRFSFELASSGITIVSGLARGIDSIAHRAALDAGGRTIAVLGSGVDIIYPREHRDLAIEISKRGAVVSQFPYGTPPLKQNFLERNGTIASLSKAILVIEGGMPSGTLSTATWAADQGKEVFVIPGSEVTDFLYGEGARVVNSASDILEYLDSIK